MAPTLRLEYACTSAEMNQAQTLALRKQLGGGSKWRTRVILWLMLVGMLLGGWIRFREIPEGYRVLLLAGCVAFGVVFMLVQKKRRKTSPLTSQLEISEEQVT